MSRDSYEGLLPFGRTHRPVYTGFQVQKELDKSVSFSEARYTLSDYARFREVTLATNPEGIKKAIKVISRFRNIFGADIVFKDARPYYVSSWELYGNYNDFTFEVINKQPLEPESIKGIYMNVGLYDEKILVTGIAKNCETKCVVCGTKHKGQKIILLGGVYETLCQRCQKYDGEYEIFSTMRRLKYVLTNNAKVDFEEVIEENQRKKCTAKISNFSKKHNISETRVYAKIKKSGIFKYNGRIALVDLKKLKHLFKIKR